MAENNQAAAPTTEELLAQLAASQAELKTQKEAEEQYKTVIASQASTIAELDAQKGSANAVVTVDKKKYEVVCPSFQHTDGKKYTADDVKKDQSLAKELVKMGSGVLVEVEAPKA
ncbi:hypothetical protein [Rufibacter soli]